MRSNKCPFCGSVNEPDDSSLGPDPFCSNDCVSDFRAMKLREIAEEHKLVFKELQVILAKVEKLPKFSRR